MRFQKEIRTLIRNSACYILAKNLVTFCLSPKNWSKAEFKSNELICLVEQISRQDCTWALSWLPFSALIQVYGERERATSRGKGAVRRGKQCEPAQRHRQSRSEKQLQFLIPLKKLGAAGELEAEAGRSL